MEYYGVTTTAWLVLDRRCPVVAPLPKSTVQGAWQECETNAKGRNKVAMRAGGALIYFQERRFEGNGDERKE